MKTPAIYVALLRGINVGGNAKVSMKVLKETFESLGYNKVITYINSGNVVFESEQTDEQILASAIEKAIEKDFGFAVKTIVRSKKNISEITHTIPENWVNDTEMKCDVLFLWPNVDTPNVITELPIKPGVDDVIHTAGVIAWRFDRKNLSRSGATKIIGSTVYKNMTARNINTVRKIESLMAGH